MSQLTTQGVYDRVLLRETVLLENLDAAQFNNLRTSLLRKFRKSREDFVKCGFPWNYDQEFIECRYNKDTFTAEFKLSPLSQRKTRLLEFSVREL